MEELTTTIRVRVTNSTKRKLERLAQRREVKLSHLVREALAKKIKEGAK